MIDVQEKKKKIISFLENNGPSLPVRIAKAIEMDPVFASAILSELLNTKQIKISNLKVGASPLYLLPEQEQKLEEYIENLKPIENEAYIKLKENKLITDEKEEPAIRIALRNIKDFAIPFKFKEKIMWKYKFTSDEEIEKILSPGKKEKSIPKTENNVPKAWESKKEESKKIENIFRKQPSTSEVPSKSQIPNPKSPHITPRTFLEQIEKFLETQNTKIISIEEVDKKKVIAKTKTEFGEALLFAFNKKKINETELMKC